MLVKEKGERLFKHEQEALKTNCKTHKLNTIRKILKAGFTPTAQRVSSLTDEVTALAKEQLLIAAIGRADTAQGPLTNHTNGGEGFAGGRHSEESRRKIAKASQLVWDNLSARQRKQIGVTRSVWWHSLDDEEQQALLENRKGWFSRLSASEQERLKRVHAERAKKQWDALTTTAQKRRIANMNAGHTEESRIANGEKVRSY